MGTGWKGHRGTFWATTEGDRGLRIYKTPILLSSYDLKAICKVFLVCKLKRDPTKRD